MNFKPELSEDELRALLGGEQQDDGAGLAEGERSIAAESAVVVERERIDETVGDAKRTRPFENDGLRLYEIGTQQDGELLQALKEVVKTLTVRVASLEGEVGRLRAELAASRGELPSAGPRIVVEGVALPTLPAEAETAASAQEAAVPRHAASKTSPLISETVRDRQHDTMAATGADVSLRTEIPFDAAKPIMDDSVAAHGLSRTSTYRKPKKKGFFARWFD
jgi:hypothetical protein